jgi:hypothetical protein
MDAQMKRPGFAHALSLAAAIALIVPACGGYSKETVSLYRDHVGMRVPNQQRLLALATDEAVQRLDFKTLAGRKVVVEMSGIFPHTRGDVLDYIQNQVEGKIARDGGLVISAGQIVTTSSEATGSGAESTVGSISLTPADAEYRVLIGVSWAGVDTHDKKVVNTPLLTKQLLMIGGGIALSILGPAATSDNATAAGILGILGIGTTLGGVTWRIIEKPTLHIYRLLGRVRVSVNAVPLVPGGTAFQTVGEGQTELLIDPTAEEGYFLQ